MSNPSKAKGDRTERQLIDRLESVPGVLVKKVGLRLQAGRVVRGDVVSTFQGHSGDTRLPLRYWTKMYECKARKKNKGYGQLLKWIDGVDYLSLKVEGSMEPLIVMHWKQFEELLRAIIHEPVQETKVEPLERREVSPVEYGPREQGNQPEWDTGL